jgi:hypothetical protein
MVGAGRGPEGPIVTLIIDTPTGRFQCFVGPDQWDALAEGLGNAIRQAKTGLVIAHAPGNGKPIHNGRVTDPGPDRTWMRPGTPTDGR